MQNNGVATASSSFVAQYWLAFVWLATGIIGTGIYVWAFTELSTGQTRSSGVSVALLVLFIGVIREFIRGFRTDAKGISGAQEQWIVRLLQVAVLGVTFPPREIIRQVVFLVRVQAMWKRGEIAVAENNPRKLVRAG